MTLQELGLSLEMGFLYGMVAMGIYMTFRVIDFPDLTCDGSFVLGMATCATLILKGYSPWVSTGAAILAGAFAGLLTGFLHTRLKISDLLSGILVAFMLYSINLKIMGDIPNIALLGLPTLLWPAYEGWILGGVACLGVGMVGYLLMTEWGLALRSIGQNKRFAQNGGVRVSAMVLWGLMISNGLIALGGALFAQHQGFADINSGLGTLIIGLTSVIIGEKIWPSRTMWGQLAACIVGSTVYRMLIGLALHTDALGLATQDLNVITGLLVIGAMMMGRRTLLCSR